MKSLAWLSLGCGCRDTGAMVASKDRGELSPASGPSWQGARCCGADSTFGSPGEQGMYRAESARVWVPWTASCQHCPEELRDLSLITLALCKRQERAGNAPGVQDSSQHGG